MAAARRFARLTLMLWLTGLAGCTAAVWERPHYVEGITGFYISQDDNLLIGANQDYSYVFNIDPVLTQALLLDRSICSDMTLSTFSLHRDNTVTGNIFLYANSAELEQGELDTISGLNFEKYKKLPPVGENGWQPDARTWRRGDYRLVARLEGRRYVTDAGSEIRQLEEPIGVAMYRSNSPSEIAGKALITPGSVVIDATAFTVVLPITLTMYLGGDPF